MRNLLILLAISVCLLSLGCSSNDESVYFTPVTTATIAAYGKVSFPVKNKLDAIILARKLIQTSRFVSIGEPQVVYVEKIRPAEADLKIGPGPSFIDRLPKNAMVWLVIFEGEWQLAFPVPNAQGMIPTLAPPFHGCEYCLFDADNGDPITIGGFTCPSEAN
jgi:hypothetical protein